MDVKMTEIERRRKELGLSRAELSNLSEVPVRTIENWEYRKNKTRDAYSLKKIADIFKCTIDDILEPLDNYK